MEAGRPESSAPAVAKALLCTGHRRSLVRTATWSPAPTSATGWIER